MINIIIIQTNELHNYKKYHLTTISSKNDFIQLYVVVKCDRSVLCNALNQQKYVINTNSDDRKK